MDRCGTRLLILACSLLLALPQGWCCLFAVYQVNARTTAPATVGTIDNASGHCPFCHHQPPNQTTGTETAPGVPPSLPQKFVCPCADRHTTLTAPLHVEQETGFILPLPRDVSHVPRQVAVAAGIAFAPSTPPLHVLNQVWLC
jgi:hypothetical protein